MQRDREGVDWTRRSIDIITLLILAAGFYFIITQMNQLNSNMKETQKSSYLGTWNHVFQQWLDFDKMIIDNPDIRPYIYFRKDIPSDDPEFAKIQSVATYIIDFIDYVENNYILDERFRYFVHPEILESRFFQIFANSPIVCRILLTSNQSLYAKIKDLAQHSCSMQTK